MLPDPILPTPEDDIARILRDYERRLSHLERLEERDIGARVVNSANILIANNALVELTFDTERYDTNNIHSTVLNTSRLTTVIAGKYLVVGNVEWATNAVARRFVIILLNGAIRIAQVGQDANSADVTQQIATTIYELAVGDFVELQVFQDSGGALNVLNAGRRSPEFMMQKVG